MIHVWNYPDIYILQYLWDGAHLQFERCLLCTFANFPCLQNSNV